MTRVSLPGTVHLEDSGSQMQEPNTLRRWWSGVLDRIQEDHLLFEDVVQSIKGQINHQLLADREACNTFESAGAWKLDGRHHAAGASVYCLSSQVSPEIIRVATGGSDGDEYYHSVD